MKKLFVGIYGSLATCASLLAVTPVVKTVPWVASNPLIPHDTWSGKDIVLKGTSDVQGPNFEYTWDFGDASPVASGTVVNQSAIDATHTYLGTLGTIFTARLTVRDTGTGESASKEYYVEIRQQVLGTEVNVAIDDGLWQMHKTLVRFTDGSGNPCGYWEDIINGSYARPAVAAAYTLAFEVNGHLQTGNSSNPYTETVGRALCYLFSQLDSTSIGVQPFGNPDSNGNGIGILVYGNPFGNNWVYQQGQIMDAIIASGTPAAIAPAGPASVAGRTYKDIVQDMVDALAWAQSDYDAPYGGGWRYVAHQFPDNSACQWAAIGLIPAERKWGCTVPAFVKERNRVWLEYSQDRTGSDTGVFGYEGSAPVWGPYTTTPSGMVQMAMDGIGRGTVVSGVAMWELTETFIRDNFCNTYARGTQDGALQNIKGFYYGLFSFVKSLLLHDSNGDGVAESIDLLGGDLDWYGAEVASGAPCDGVARTLVDDQTKAGPDRGQWLGHNYRENQYPFETGFALVMLNRTLFEAGAPVAVARATPNPAVAGQAITLDGSASFHQDADRSIVQWDWDLNNDGTYDFSGPIATTSFGALGNYPVGLRVTDDSIPAKTATTVVTVIVSVPPLAPTADAGGPYSFCPGTKPWFLNGLKSKNPDEGQSEPGRPGDTITDYAWDLDGDGQFNDAFGATPDVTAFFAAAGPGNHLIQLRVTDRTSISFPSSGFGDLSDTDSAQVFIRSATEAECACVNDLTARAKTGKIQIVWTHTGALRYNVYRSTVSGGPYIKLAETSSTYSTYLDSTIVNGTPYYYVVREVLPNATERCQSNEATATARDGRQFVTVPNVIGFTPAAAQSAIEAANLTLGAISTANSATVPQGQVISQNPAAGALVPPATAVALVISLGPVNVIVPNVVGLTQASAQSAIQAANLTVGTISTANSATVPQGQVISQNPLAGALVPPGTAVALVISLGPANVTVPNVVGLTQTEAQTAIQVANLTIGTITTANNPTVPAGNVISQDPAAGASVPPATAVALVISLGPANHDPVIISQPITSVVAGQKYTYDVDARDPDNDSLIYSLLEFPTGMTVDSNTGVLSWNTAPSDVGMHAVTVRVIDSQGGSAEQNYLLNVTEPPQNNPPFFTSVPITSFTITTQNETPEVIDLSKWSIVQYEFFDQPDASWTLSENNTVATQTVNADASILLSDFELSSDEIQGTWSVQSSNDDDFMGFVFGFQDRQHFYLFDWKQADQDDANVGFAERGMSVKVVSADSDLRETDVWPTSSPDPARVHAIYHNTIPYDDFKEYQFTLAFKPGAIKITVKDGTTILAEISLTDSTYATGEFGFYNDSQEAVRYTGFTHRMLIDAPYIYDADATDPDGDDLVYSLATAPSGMTLNPNTGLIQWSPTADQIGDHDVSVQADDGRGGTATQSYVLTVRSASANLPPVITSTAPLLAAANVLYSYNVGATDPEGNAIAFSLVTGPAGMTIDAMSGQVRWTPGVGDIGAHSVELRATDAPGAFASQSFTIQVNQSISDTEPPVVTLQIVVGNQVLLGAEVAVPIGTTAEFRVSAIDNVGVTERTLKIGDQSIALNAQGRATLQLNTVSVSTVSANAKDAAGNVGTASQDLRVFDPNDTTPPTVSITTPTDNAEVSGLTQVIGSAFDPDGQFGYYTVEFAPVELVNLDTLESSDFIEIARGLNEVHDGLLATFDPTMLSNDSYVIRVSGWDQNGQGQRKAVIVNVFGNLKLGNFRLEFTDLTVPLAGVPIKITRIYDTLDAKRKGDFGFGWRLGLRDARILEVGKAPFVGLGGEEFTLTTHSRIYINTPDGRRVGFSVEPEFCAGGLFFKFYRPVFKPDPGVYEKFEAVGNSCAYAVDAEGRFVNGFAALTGIDPTAYLLTMKDGTVYEYDQTQGLQKITDLNGNRLVFDNNGIFHYPAGSNTPDQQIPFTRDAEGRITRIVDPNGNGLSYTYDATGDLRSFTDQAANATRYDYHPNRPHYLDTIKDPLGHSVVRTEYDAQGRVIAVTDALGNKVNESFDPNANAGTYTDALGNISTIEYDGRGNVTRVADPLGNEKAFVYDENDNVLEATLPCSCGSGTSTTHRTYDANGNVTSITDALGNTISFTYNQFNKVAQKTDALGRTIKYEYDLQGNLVKLTNPAAVASSITYDSNGRPISYVDNNGNITQLQYEAGPLPARVTYPGGSSRQLFYNASGWIIRITDELGGNISINYNSTGQPILVSDQEGRETKLEYDAGRLVRQIDPLGRTKTYAYDDAGRRVSEKDALGGETKWEYDGNNQIIGMVDARGNRTRKLYRADGKLESVTDALGHQTKHVYDDAGDRIETIDPLGRSYRYEYDAIGRLIRQINPESGVHETSYDAVGNRLSETDENGHITRYAYDSLNHLISQMDALGGLSRRGYDPAGNLIQVIDALGRITTSSYDVRNRLIRVVDPSGSSEDYEYDATGNRISVTDKLGKLTRYEYSPAAHLVRIIDALGGTLVSDFDAAGNLIAVTDQTGGVTQHTYDALNRRIRTSDANGGIAQFEYDAAGNRTSIVDPIGNINHFTYDPLNRLIEQIDPLGHHSAFTYDEVGNHLESVDRNGRRRTFIYDGVNRVTTEKWWNGAVNVRTISYTYDAVGNILSAADPDSSYTQTYDALDRLTSVDNLGTPLLSRLVLQYAYDAVGNVTSVIDDIGYKVNSVYDENHRLIRRSWQGGSVAPARMDFAYDGAGNRISQEYFKDLAGILSGGVSLFNRDNLGRVAKIVHKNPAGTSLAEYAYQFNKKGLVTDETYQGNSTQFSYDATGQLIQAVRTSGANENYVYDANGNRTGAALVTGPGNQLLSDGLFDYEYDNEGNLIHKIEATSGSRTEFFYDHRNRLIKAEQKTADGTLVQTVDLTFDVNGRRIAKAVNGVAIYSAYDGEDTWADLDGSGQTLARYLHGDQIDQVLARHQTDGQVTRYLGDRLGTLRDSASASGDLTGQTSYRSFGEIIARTGSLANDRFSFTGREFDQEIGTYHYRARSYAADSGRFLSQDPLGFEAGDANLYRYVFNNPINFTDPTGRQALPEYAEEVSEISLPALAARTAVPVLRVVVDNTLRDAAAKEVGELVVKSVAQKGLFPLTASIGTIFVGLATFLELQSQPFEKDANGDFVRHVEIQAGAFSGVGEERVKCPFPDCSEARQLYPYGQACVESVGGSSIIEFYKVENCRPISGVIGFGEIRACSGAPSVLYHCGAWGRDHRTGGVTYDDNAVSFFSCVCCEPDGTYGICYKGCHPASSQRRR